MTEPERSHLSGKALEVYDRMLERVKTRLHDLEETSLQNLEEAGLLEEEEGEGRKITEKGKEKEYEDKYTR